MLAHSTTFVEELAQHVHPREGPKEFCMIAAFMDESGIHEGAHVCVVGGYWGSLKKWKRFEPHWKEIIDSADEPSLREFHSTDFWYADGTRKGVFGKWSANKADSFIDALIDCIVDSKIFPTTAVLVVEDWKKLSRNERIFLTGGYYDNQNNCWATQGAPNRIYFLPFQMAVAAPAINCPPGLHVHYTFDLNKQFKTHAARIYSLMKTYPHLECRHRLGTLSNEIPEKAIGLQAADLFAYQTYKFAKQRIGRNTPFKPSELPPLLRRLLTHMQHEGDFPFFDAVGLEVALGNMPKELRGK